MTSSTRFNIWSENSVNARSIQYSEAVLNIVFNRRGFNYSKYKSGKYHNNIIKNYAYSGEYIVISETEKDIYQVLGPGIEYFDNDSNEIKYSCREYELECVSGEGTNKKCNKNKCIWGKLIKEDEIYKYEPMGHKEDYSYYTVSALRNNLFSYQAVISEKIPEFDLWDLKNIIILQAYSEKCGKNEACINSNLTTNNKQEIILSLISYLNTIDEGWKEYILGLLEETINNESLTAYEFCLIAVKTIHSFKNKILLYRLKTKKYNNFIITKDNTFSRPVYYRLPAVYKSNDGEKDIIFLRNIEQRFFVNKEDIELGTIIISSDLKEAYYYLPRSITHPLERLKYNLDPFNMEEKYSPLDLHSWKLVPQENIPKLNISKWITEGFDYFLSFCHSRLERFFHDFLDPETCFEVSLDWIYQFFGWSPSSWDLNWDGETKRALLKNSLGWAEDDLFKIIFQGQNSEKLVKTYKGRIVEDFPFDRYKYSDDQMFWIDTQKIEGDFDTPEGDVWEEIFWGNLNPTKRIYNSQTKLVEEDKNINITISKRRWKGLWQSKGTLLGMIFLFSAFKFTNSLAEDEISIDPNTNMKIIDLKNNINKQNLVPLKPIILSPLQATYPEDITILDNPFIAGISQIGYDSPQIILPISYKYSRFGEFWQIGENLIFDFAPITASIRIQYPYIVADYATADDFYFDFEN